MNDADEFARYHNAKNEPPRSDQIDLLVMRRCELSKLCSGITSHCGRLTFLRSTIFQITN